METLGQERTISTETDFNAVSGYLIRAISTEEAAGYPVPFQPVCGDTSEFLD